MAKVLCVLYDDPVDGYPTTLRARRHPDARALPGRPDAADARRRSTSRPGELLGSVSGELGLRKFLEAHGHTLVVTSDKDGPDSVVRARAARRRHRHLAAVLARLPDRRADRQGAEPQARDHRRHRLRPRRPAGGDRARDHRRRGHLLQQHQRRRARRDDDPGARAQLHPVLPVGRRRAAGTSPTASRAPTTSRACRSAPSPPAGSARPCCGG